MSSSVGDRGQMLRCCHITEEQKANYDKTVFIFSLPDWPVGSDVPKEDQVEHLVQINDHSEDVAESEHKDDCS